MTSSVEHGPEINGASRNLRAAEAGGTLGLGLTVCSSSPNSRSVGQALKAQENRRTASGHLRFASFSYFESNVISRSR